MKTQNKSKLSLSRDTLKDLTIRTGVRAGCVLTNEFPPSALCPTKSICGCHGTKVVAK